MTGYPDWQAYPSRVGGNLLGTDSIDLAPGKTVYGPYGVTSWGGVSVLAVPSAGYGTVRADWWESSAMTSNIKYDSWAVSVSFGLLVTVPSWGPWVSFTFDVTSTANMTGPASARGLASVSAGFEFPVTGGGLDKAAVTLAAGASVTYPVLRIRRGLAFLSFLPYDTAGKLDVSVVQLNADSTSLQTLAHWGAPAAQLNSLFTLPGVAAGLSVANTDTAASHEFDARLTFA